MPSLIIRFQEAPQEVDRLVKRIHRRPRREVRPQGLESLVARGCHAGPSETKQSRPRTFRRRRRVTRAPSIHSSTVPRSTISIGGASRRVSAAA